MLQYTSLLELLTESDEAHRSDVERRMGFFLDSLKEFKKVLFITTSNRYKKESKSTKFAKRVGMVLKEEKVKVRLIEANKLKIYPCTGNVSDEAGNICGVADTTLKDDERNPTGYHRCWTSLNYKDDELWRVSKELFETDAVVFFGSVRWGQTNSIYQQLIERLSWIENRKSTLKEEPIPEIGKISAGIVLFGQNWNGEQVLETQVQVLKYFGFKVPDTLSFHWQFTDNADDESKESYLEAPKEYQQLVQIAIPDIKKK